MRRTRRLRTAWVVFAAVLPLAIAVNPARGDRPAAPLGDFRSELTSFVADLEAVAEMEGVAPDVRGRIAAARLGIETLSDADLARTEAALAKFPEWRAMPAMVRLLAENRDRIRELAETRAELESYRQLLDAAHATTGGSGTLDEAAVAEMRRITQRLRAIYDELAPVRAAFGGGGQSGIRMIAAPACDTDCGDLEIDCWIDAAICLIDEVDDLLASIANFVTNAINFFVTIGNEIASLFTDIGNAFAGLFDEIEELLVGLFDDLMDVIPTSPGEILSLTGLDDPEWYLTVVDALPQLDPPCPATGTDIPGIGEVGTARAEWACKRGIDWFAHLIYDLVPDDVYDVPVKIPATLVYYPINYFCLCMESQSALASDAADSAHQELVTDHLDAVLSTRATDASLTAARGALTDLDGGVAAVEAKLDVLDGKVDQMRLLQGDQDEFLEAFRDLLVRLEVEQNLLDHGDDPIGLFQLPEALGGRLEEVRGIVLDSIAMNQASGQNVYGAAREVALGDAAADQGDYAAAFARYQLAYRQLVKQ